jgi:hypothetical protein
MTDQNTNSTTETEATEAQVVVEPTRLQKFVNNHPRASRVIAIVGGVAAVAGVGTVARTATKNKHHLDNAAGHVLEAGSELSAAVSPTSETDAA